MGYVGWIGSQGGERKPGCPKLLQSELVRELRTLGAVVIAKVFIPILSNCFVVGRSLICCRPAQRRLFGYIEALAFPLQLKS
jgi:hypothetical protein